MKRMHAARIEDSPRLQKVLEFLRHKRAATTFEIIQGCNVCAVNSIIAELRANGYNVTCSAVPKQRGVYRYELIEGDQLSLFRSAA